MEVTVKPRRPPSLPCLCEVFPDHSSFSVFRETLMAFFYDYFKRPNGYKAASGVSEGMRRAPQRRPSP
jgi:hypothetical protein